MTRELFVIFFILLVVRSEFDEASDEEATDADNKANASAKYDIHNIHDRKSCKSWIDSIPLLFRPGSSTNHASTAFEGCQGYVFCNRQQTPEEFDDRRH